jgi:hypothetical protein
MRGNQSIKTTFAVALLLSAITVPAAHARSGENPVVLPNPDEQTASVYAAASAAPSLIPQVVRPNPDEQQSVPQSGRQHPPLASNRGSASPSARTAVVGASVSSGGFDWGDAGIGAGVALALVGFVLAGTRMVTNHRSHPIGHERVGASS